MKFDVNPKNPVDPEALARFAAGADPDAIEKPVDRERNTESMLFRCSQATVDEFNFVFENMNVKSKQKLLELILLPEIKRLADAIRAKQ